MDFKCPIWGTPATVDRSAALSVIDSKRAGGKYKIHQMYEDQLRAYSPQVRFPLTNWLVAQRISGNDQPKIEINSEFLAYLSKQDQLPSAERLRRFFIYCHHYKKRIGSRVFYRQFNSSSSGNDYTKKNESDDDVIYAFSEIIDDEDCYSFIAYLIDLEYMNSNFKLLPKAFERIDSFNLKKAEKQVFVAMWFGQEVQSVYEIGIAPAVREAGYVPLRVDQKEHNNKIDDEIIAELRRSLFVIADFTSPTHQLNGSLEAVSRGGVYYEAGFAHGLGIPVIWTCREDMIGLVHFDTRQYNHITWKDADDLKEKLINRIRATIV